MATRPLQPSAAAPATIVVAAVCARWLAESARRAGWQVIALDLFGDADTRRASLRWQRIGDAAAFALDPAALRVALHRAAREPRVIGWVAGSGFEAVPDALEMHVPGLPLLGMEAQSVRRVRDPRSFFATLDQLGLDHPQVGFAAPAQPAGWLVKNPAGAGGWHIRPASGNTVAPAGAYWQGVQPGQPMSALFLADGTRARLVALNSLLVRPLGELPYVYAGAIGPIHDDALARQLDAALQQLVPAFALRGLASLDFIAHAGRAWLLELNARPSATMALHESAWPGGLLHAHVRAVAGALPAEDPVHPAGMRGCRTLFADSACRVGLALAAELAQAADCHDLPAPGSHFAPGEPVCTVSAGAPDAQALLAALDARAAQIRSRFGCATELVA